MDQAEETGRRREHSMPGELGPQRAPGLTSMSPTSPPALMIFCADGEFKTDDMTIGLAVMPLSHMTYGVIVPLPAPGAPPKNMISCGMRMLASPPTSAASRRQAAWKIIDGSRTASEKPSQYSAKPSSEMASSWISAKSTCEERGVRGSGGVYNAPPSHTKGASSRAMAAHASRSFGRRGPHLEFAEVNAARVVQVGHPHHPVNLLICHLKVSTRRPQRAGGKGGMRSTPLILRHTKTGRPRIMPCKTKG
eukprot:scaffold23599_cov26-Tisochrysis_lutea.AAC.2